MRLRFKGPLSMEEDPPEALGIHLSYTEFHERPLVASV